ncbi:hypothetical protein GCM10007094_41370 [Pseudovibrio japonicus]|uniref:Uncharacterized protein n=1 Tax=Pseudovibrio japonicus TaxID=366534 RepID=A0ABQ3ENF5_9HYPH|nr:hypothetical protein GCM10007094_41370 [Pseudovibrio japonicus]
MKISTCPFCQIDDTQKVVVNKEGRIWVSHVECPACGAQGPVHYDAQSVDSAKDEAIFLWNDRPSEKLQYPRSPPNW